MTPSKFFDIARFAVVHDIRAIGLAPEVYGEFRDFCGSSAFLTDKGFTVTLTVVGASRIVEFFPQSRSLEDVSPAVRIDGGQKL